MTTPVTAHTVVSQLMDFFAVLSLVALFIVSKIKEKNIFSPALIFKANQKHDFKCISIADVYTIQIM